jgi:hypothetical protein
VLLECGRVALGLLENALHKRVLENGHDLQKGLILDERCLDVKG